MIHTWFQVKAEPLVKTLTKRKVDTENGTVDFNYTIEEVYFWNCQILSTYFRTFFSSNRIIVLRYIGL